MLAFGADFIENPLGKGFIAGVDEAGRGPLCGDVVAAAVILDRKNPIEGLNDSKKLSEKKRELLFDCICHQCIAYAVGRASVEEIDRINILHASMLAMQRAVKGLSKQPELALIDGNRCPQLSCEAQSVVKGDGRILEIAAASIIAKVVRDREMVQMDQKYPGYGIAIHKGYPTRAHMTLLKELGPSPIHRRSFRPVKVLLEAENNEMI
ncbi:Ribonuclease HII [invertebrate metagenome]|uniref:Ribonuclease HII n=1 Tax=invertebrate metagenome TaxID=1711999 RepID=A0A2H9T7D4_9ZZZZ